VLNHVRREPPATAGFFFRLTMSAFDPKQTSAWVKNSNSLCCQH
jgi:hypothetical protein